MKMHMKRYARLSNGFSKGLENHMAALALHLMFDNFAKIHGTLRCTPVRAAGVTGKLWEISDIVKLVEQTEQESNDVAYGMGGPGKCTPAK